MTLHGDRNRHWFQVRATSESRGIGVWRGFSGVVSGQDWTTHGWWHSVVPTIEIGQPRHVVWQPDIGCNLTLSDPAARGTRLSLANRNPFSVLEPRCVPTRAASVGGRPSEGLARALGQPSTRPRALLHHTGCLAISGAGLTGTHGVTVLIAVFGFLFANTS